MKELKNSIGRIFLLRNRNYSCIADTKTNFLLLFPLVLGFSFFNVAIVRRLLDAWQFRVTSKLRVFEIVAEWKANQIRYCRIYLSRDRKQSVRNPRRENPTRQEGVFNLFTNGKQFTAAAQTQSGFIIVVRSYYKLYFPRSTLPFFSFLFLLPFSFVSRTKVRGTKRVFC